MFAKRKIRRSAYVAMASMLLATGISFVPLGSTDAGWRARATYNNNWRPRPGYGGYYGHRYNNGDAVAAGVAGLAAGAIIGGALTQPRAYPYASPPSSVYVGPPRQPYDSSVTVSSGGVPAGTYQPAQNAASWHSYCASKYRSYNPATGMFLGHDGQYHRCQ